MKSSIIAFLCSLALLLCMLCGCEKPVSPYTGKPVAVDVAMAEWQRKAVEEKVASEKAIAKAKARADALIEQAASQVEVINRKAEVSALEQAAPIIAEAKREAALVQSDAEAAVAQRAEVLAAYRTSIEDARAKNAEWAGLAGGLLDFAQPVAEAGVSSTGVGALLLPLIGLGGWWARSRIHKASDAAWDESQADAAKKKAAEDAAWEQSQAAGQLQAALIALINKNTPPTT